MGFDKVLLVSSEKTSEKHMKTLSRVRDMVGERIVKEVVISAFSVLDLEGVDVVLVVGGDGTFIRAAHYVRDVPILGINSDPAQSFGEWMSITAHQLDLLSDVFSGKVSFEEYSRIEVFVNDERLPELAINEVFVGAKHQYHTARYFLEIGDSRENQRSSGVLVVTKRGSNAWYKSAGGNPFFHDGLKYLVREPFITPLFDSDLVQGRIEGDVKVISSMQHEGVVVFDSNVKYDFHYGDHVVIKKSDSSLRVVVV